MLKLSWTGKTALEPQTSSASRTTRLRCLLAFFCHVHSHIYVCIYKYTYMHTHIYTYIHTYTHTYIDTHTYTPTYLPTYLHTCMHTYADEYIYVFTGCMRINTQSKSEPVLTGYKAPEIPISPHWRRSGPIGAWGVSYLPKTAWPRALSGREPGVA